MTNESEKPVDHIVDTNEMVYVIEYVPVYEVHST